MMKVVELVNLLQRFPGAADVTVDGDVSVETPDGPVSIVGDGVAAAVEKGTKGAAGIGPVSGDRPKRSRARVEK